MPSLDNICMYAMYVIGDVESNHDWASVYYVDPITIGMMQNYGQHARELLALCSASDPGYAAFAQAAPQLAADVADSEKDNWDWWSRRYLTQTEGNAFKEMAASNDNHIIQQTKWIADAKGYIELLEKWGCSQNNPQALVYAMCMYHQRPASCSNVIATAGGTATLDRMHEVCLNERVFSKYSNRYNRAYELLSSWDGESAPPDFGQVTGETVGGNESGIGVSPSNLSYIIQRGDLLFLVGDNNYKNGVAFAPAGVGKWVCSSNADGTPITGGNTGGGSATGNEGQRAVVTLYKSWEELFDYSQAPGRLDPVTSGYGDCSSTIWAAYHDATGVNVGTWTGDMLNYGTEIATGSGGLPYDNMQLGDLVLINWGNYNSDYDHVEMYIGDGQLMGHGGGKYHPKGPWIKASGDDYLTAGNCHDWQIRRYL